MTLIIPVSAPPRVTEIRYAIALDKHHVLVFPSKAIMKTVITQGDSGLPCDARGVI